MHLRRSSKGGAALELAVVFPVLLLLIIGVVDYGRMYFTAVTVANAARAGAEWGSEGTATYADTASWKQFAKLDGAEVSGIIIKPREYCQCGGAASSCTSFCAGGAAPEVYVEVKASDTLTTLLPYPGLPKKLTVVRTATFRTQ
jgi:hypothetical protein